METVARIPPRIGDWNWRRIGFLVVGLFLVGFIFGGDDWFGLGDRRGFWPQLALRAVRGFASAILAPLLFGFLSAISHLFQTVPFRAAANTWPGGSSIWRWFVGIALLTAPIYLIWGALRLIGVGPNQAATTGVATTIAFWLLVALIRALRASR